VEIVDIDSSEDQANI